MLISPWLRTLIGIAIAMHGIGHILFLIPALKIADWGQSTRSWLLTGLLGDGLTRALAAVLWLAVLLAYAAGIFGFFTHAAWWQPVLIGASLASAVGLLLLWVNSAPAPVISALIFDLALVSTLLIFRYPAV